MSKPVGQSSSPAMSQLSSNAPRFGQAAPRIAPAPFVDPAGGAPGSIPLLQRVVDLNPAQPIEALRDPNAFYLDLNSWETITTGKVLEKSIVSSSQFSDVVLLADDVLLTASYIESILIERWDLTAGKIIASNHLNNITFPCILMNNGHFLHVNGQQLILIDTANLKRLKILQIGHSITHLIHLKNSLIAVGIDYTSVEIWDIQLGVRVSKIQVVDLQELRQCETTLLSARAWHERLKIDYNSELDLPRYQRSDWKLGDFHKDMKAQEEKIRQAESSQATMSIHRLDALPDGNLSILMHDRTRMHKFSLEGISMQISPEEISLIEEKAKFGRWESESAKLKLSDGRHLSFEIMQTVSKGWGEGKNAGAFTRIHVWQSNKQKLLTLFAKNPEKELWFSPDVLSVLKLSDLDELITICEENNIVKGFHLPESFGTPLLRTRAHHLYFRPVFSLKERAAVVVPEDYLCSITQQIMLDSAIAADGESYERSAIMDWRTRSQLSPKHGSPLEHNHLTPNRNLQRRIDDFLQKYPFLFEEENGSEHSVYTKGIFKEVQELFGKRDNANLQRLIERYPVLMTHPVLEEKTVLHLACAQPSVELLKAVLKGLGKNIVPILMKHNIELFFRMAAHAMGSEGAKLIADATFWKEADYLKESLEAIQKGDIVIMNVCLSLGLSVDAVEDQVSIHTLLHVAVAANQEKMVEFLVNYGADIYLKNWKGQIAEDLAYQLGHQHLVRAIKETHLRKITAPQMNQQLPGGADQALVEQNKQLAEQVDVLRRQMAELLAHQRENQGNSATLSASSTTLVSSKK